MTRASKKSNNPEEARRFYPPAKDRCIFCDKWAYVDKPIFRGWMPGDDPKKDEHKYLMHTPCLAEAVRTSNGGSIDRRGGGLLTLDLCMCEEKCKSDDECKAGSKPVDAVFAQSQPQPPSPPPAAAAAATALPNPPPKVQGDEASEIAMGLAMAVFITIFFIFPLIFH